MNRYVRAAYVVPIGAVKMILTKLFHFRGFKGSPVCMMSPLSELSMDYGAELRIGRMLKVRDNAKIRVRRNASCTIGNHVQIGSGCIITCRENITIGSETQLGPNVVIFDHDHDFRGCSLSEGKYRTKPIHIGERVWIGANASILKGVTIGDGAVVGAGTVVTKDIPAQTIYVEKRNGQYISYS